MKTFKAQLLAATVAACTFASTAQAQFEYPTSELRGAGASSIANVLVQSLNCISGNNGVGSSNGTAPTIAEFNYQPASPTASNPNYNCSTQEIQPNVEGKYVSTGSGTGRRWWTSFTNQLTGSLVNPFAPPAWTNLSFAFSDAPASPTDLTNYGNGAGSAANGAGPAIQFPLYVLPVALAYNPVYGVKRSGTNSTTPLRFNVKPAYVTTDSAGNPTGGLRLTRNMYCKIFNGYITNFNDRAFATTGVNKSLKDPNDNATRWNTEGVPIRLVGRLDSSGTTDIFTRHLAAACTGQSGVTTNKFAKNSEALPFNRNSNIDLREFRADTRYFTGTTADLAGETQSLSGAVFIRASGGNPASISTKYGNEQAGLFMVADGSSGVRDAINFQAQPGSKNGTVALNGKFGYIGGDFVKPSVGASLFSAALQIAGVGTQYASATAADALAAFGTNRYLPPETTSQSGAYSTSDTRKGPSRDGTSQVPIDRANPLHWTSVLYSEADTLASPRLGYPFTGTTQYLGYTCYAKAADRLAVVALLSLYTSRLTQDSTGDKIPAGLVTNTSNNSLGLLASSNVAPLPAAWQTAIGETFLRKSGTTALANKQLWIQDRLPTKGANQAKPNPDCTDGKGA